MSNKNKDQETTTMPEEKRSETELAERQEEAANERPEKEQDMADELRQEALRNHANSQNSN